MNSYERVLTALNLEEPDRVPNHLLYIDANNVDILLGKPEMSDFDIVEQIKKNNPQNWAEELSNLVESVETTVFSRTVEAAVQLGLDMMQVGIIPLYFFDDPNDSRLLMKDIFGRVWEARNNEGNFNPYYLYGTMNSPEQWAQIKSDLEGPLKEKYKKFVKKFYRRINKNLEINEEEGKKTILKIIQNTINEIMIIGRGEGEDVEDYSKITINIAILADNWSKERLYKLYKILQAEVDFIGSFRGLNDKFSCLSNLLLQEFHNDFIEKRNIEKSIEEKIKDLEE